MKKRAVVLSSLMIVIFLTTAAAPFNSQMSGLDPGDYVVYDQTIPVNIVFIGYDESTIDEGAFSSWLPLEYEPLVRYPEFYGVSGRPMGLHYDFEYEIMYASDKQERQFFKFLENKGEPGPMTLFQSDYNDQVNNVLDVTDPVLYIDAPTVEQWLLNYARNLNINVNQSYTVFFINWYSRDDFQFHVYTKTDEPDPDTGYNFGVERASRKVIAWGGDDNSRVWFYDLSAGPEAWTDNWNVDNPEWGYRMPPIWEYDPAGYRDPSELPHDLGLVARFVAIDLLFTTSPLYDPLVTAPLLGGDKVAHIEMFEDDPVSSGLDWIDTHHIMKELRSFQPYYDWQVSLEDNDPIDAGAQNAFYTFTLLSIDFTECWTAFGTPFAELYCYFTNNLGTYVPAYDPDDYVGEVFAFNTTDANLNAQFGLLGFADDNWVDGTQTYVFQFDTSTYRALGYGFSDTTVHEFGHHIGMSHPHDGYDYEWDLDFGPGGAFYFVWSGDESDTVMSYISLSAGFSQFDQDNMYRWEMAGYLNWANDLLDDVLAHPDVHTVNGLLQSAENAASKAQKHFDMWLYQQAASNARRAYDLVTEAANQLGVSASAAFLRAFAAPVGEAPHEGDPIRFPDN